MALSYSDEAFGDLLLERGLLTIEQLDEAVESAGAWRVGLLDVLLARRWIEPDRLYEMLSRHFHGARGTGCDRWHHQAWRPSFVGSRSHDLLRAKGKINRLITG